jgi:hypothetical protein
MTPEPAMLIAPPLLPAVFPVKLIEAESQNVRTPDPLLRKAMAPPSTEAWLPIQLVCPPEKVNVPAPDLAKPPPFPDVALFPEKVIAP